MSADSHAGDASAVLRTVRQPGAAPPKEYWTTESALTGVRRVLELLLAGAGFALVTTAAYVLHASFSTTAFVYLVIIVMVALRWGFRTATPFSLGAIFSLDFFFTTPLFSLRIANPSDLIALAAFEFAGLVVSRLSAEAQRQASLARQERNNIGKLYLLSRSIMLLDSHQPAAAQIATFIHRAIGVDAVSLFDFATGHVYGAGAGAPELDAFVKDAWISGKNQDDGILHASARIMRLGQKGTGAIGLRAKELNPLVVDAVASIAAVALERSQSLEKEARAQAAHQSEQLRAAVLDALAHAFKTPLTAIRAASSGLLEAGSLGSREAELVTLIDQESVSLNDLATRLLRTARLEGAPVPVRRVRCDLAEVTRSVLDSFRSQMEGRVVTFCAPGPVPVWANADLIGTALTQLIDNSIRYSWPGSAITISVSKPAREFVAAQCAEAVVAVHNMGPVVRAEDRERVFERFYRAPGTEHRAAGTGLGLSIARKVAEAHHGRTWVVSDPMSGTTFFFALPSGSATHE